MVSSKFMLPIAFLLIVQLTPQMTNSSSIRGGSTKPTTIDGGISAKAFTDLADKLEQLMITETYLFIKEKHPDLADKLEQLMTTETHLFLKEKHLFLKETDKHPDILPLYLVRSMQLQIQKLRNELKRFGELYSGAAENLGCQLKSTEARHKRHKRATLAEKRYVKNAREMRDDLKTLSGRYTALAEKLTDEGRRLGVAKIGADEKLGRELKEITSEETKDLILALRAEARKMEPSPLKSSTKE